MKRYNVYCDESCHLEKDSSPVMILGAMYCPEESKKQIYEEIRSIKTKHNISTFFEIKWTKVSESKIEFYLELLDYFWENSDLHYRGLVATGKDKLNHAIKVANHYGLDYEAGASTGYTDPGKAFYCTIKIPEEKQDEYVTYDARPDVMSKWLERKNKGDKSAA